MSGVARCRRPSDTQIEQTLLQVGGFFSSAAQALGVHTSTVSRRVEKSQRLRKVVAGINNKMLDIAEASLMKAVQRGDPWAVCFFLKCKGKGRGYIQTARAEISGPDGGPVRTATADVTDEELDNILEET